ncbi:MAG: hypothetical protein WAU01_08965, partial [Saprospiraceae bacterium]
MNIIKKFNLFLLPLLLLVSCGAMKGTVISGTISGAENMTAYLDVASLTQESAILLQEKIGADGTFKMSL